MSEQDTRVALTNERGQTKMYETVASRLARFRKDHPDWTVKPMMLACDDEVVRMVVEIGYFTESNQFVLIACGHSEEYRTSEGINATSALENCETSALGRALSFVGYGSADSIATAEEVIGAKRKAETIAEAKPGAVVLLQEAAKKGSAALQDAWEKSLSKEDRQACRGQLARLKREADKVDQSKKDYERGSHG